MHKPEKPSLSSIPPELRLNILEYLFDNIVTTTSDKDLVCPVPAVLQASHRLRQDGLKLWGQRLDQVIDA
jgi:hypothetical protein